MNRERERMGLVLFRGGSFFGGGGENSMKKIWIHTANNEKKRKSSLFPIHRRVHPRPATGVTTSNVGSTSGVMRRHQKDPGCPDSPTPGDVASHYIPTQRYPVPIVSHTSSSTGVFLHP